MRLRSSEHVPGDFEPLLSEDFFPTLESADRLPIEEPTPFLLASQALKFLSVRVAHRDESLFSVEDRRIRSSRKVVELCHHCI